MKTKYRIVQIREYDRTYYIIQRKPILWFQWYDVTDKISTLRIAQNIKKDFEFKPIKTIIE